jgi:RND family efflux transporter MFP subunit
LAPQLFDRYQNDRWLITKAGISTREMAKKVVGPQHMLAKLIFILVVIAGLCLFLIRPMYHVSSTFTFQSINQRKMQAPFEGYLTAVNVRPGDSVKKGDVLAMMDTSDIEPKLADAAAKEASADADYMKFRADPDKQADADVAKAQEMQAAAEERVYQDQIDRAKIVAPFDGRIIEGDLTDQIGVPKKMGDDLFTIAADGSLRAELTVSERDIQELKVGQTGKLATTSLPTQKFPFKIERIVPLGAAKEGDNVFTVYATMDTQQPTWLPGLAGEARIDVAKKPLAWIWTHKLIDYLRLKLWM